MEDGKNTLFLFFSSLILLNITAGQQTMSSQDDHLSRQTFGLLVIWTRHVEVVCYRVIFNILTSQTRDVTEFKFLWPVNTTHNSPKSYFELLIENAILESNIHCTPDTEVTCIP